jgi:hypothetical protein
MYNNSIDLLLHNHEIHHSYLEHLVISGNTNFLFVYQINQIDKFF